MDLAGGDIVLHRAVWSYQATTVALGQAAAAYGFSYLFEITGSHTVLFEIAGGAIACGLAIDLAQRSANQRDESSVT